MSTAFDVVFGFFVVMILTLAVLSVRWAVQRDRMARAARDERGLAEEGAAPAGRRRRVPRPPRRRAGFDAPR